MDVRLLEHVLILVKPFLMLRSEPFIFRAGEAFLCPSPRQLIVVFPGRHGELIPSQTLHFCLPLRVDLTEGVRIVRFTRPDIQVCLLLNHGQVRNEADFTLRVQLV